MSRRVLVLCLVAGLAMSALVGGCAKKPEVTAPQILTMGDTTDPSTLDPQTAIDLASNKVLRACYETLVRYKGETTDVEPSLAKSWTVSPDGLTYAFTLNEGINFLDGEPFNADAVKFSFDRLKKLNQGPAYLFDNLDKVTVIDATTVEMTLKAAQPSFLFYLAGRGGYIVSPKAVADNEVDGDSAAAWLQNHVDGTGPFKLDSWEPGNQLVLSRSENYWKGWEGKHLDQIVMRVVREASSRKLQALSGELLIAQEINPQDFAELAAAPNLKMVQHPTLNTAYVFINNRKKPLDDVRVRQALAYAFDYKNFCEQVMAGSAEQLQGPLPRALWSQDPSLMMYNYDPAKAEELLKDAGVKAGAELEMIYVTGCEEDRQMSELLAAGVAPFGVKINVSGVPWPTLKSRITNPSDCPDLAVYYWFPNVADPDDWLYSMFDSANFGPDGYNCCYYRNPDVDSLIEQARATSDVATRTGLYKQAQAKIVADSPCVFVMESKWPVAINNGVKGVVFNPMHVRAYDYYEMYIEAASTK